MNDALLDALEILNCVNNDHPEDESKRLIATKCNALMRGYHKRWSDSTWVIESVEQTMTAPLLNPDTNRPSRTYTLAGKLDIVAEIDGRRTLVDHKTTSSDITELDGVYWRQLAVESQTNHYLLLGWLNGIKFDNAMWDVIRKPTIAPKKLTKAIRQAALTTGEYFGYDLLERERDELVSVERETHAMYGARLHHDCAFERPEWYFQRRHIPRMDNEILEYAQELWQHSQQMLVAKREDGRVRNPGACIAYSSACEYLGICSHADHIDSGKWRRKERVHDELPDLDGDGRGVLTNSRIKTWQACQRKEYYRYQLGLERIDQEEREALYFGSLMHKALEAYFLAMKGSCHDSNEDGEVEQLATEADEADVVVGDCI